MMEELVAQGFDRCTETDGGVHVRCSACAALVINGVACHETGCPNARKTRRVRDKDE